MREAVVKSEFQSSLGDFFSQPPERRNSSTNFSQVEVTDFENRPNGGDQVLVTSFQNRPKAGSQVRISVKFRCFIFRTARRAEIKSEIT